jgi:hypothetical protein
MERFSYGTILERFFLQFQCKTNFRYRDSFTQRNVSVTDKSFQIVERILKSNKTEKPFRFTFGNIFRASTVSVDTALYSCVEWCPFI